ncbi:rab-GTPase-TBC domain-containing protein [Melampsora americana]|nr:rab-GTPase-TBC domain-containing protein [Melampsora americana]
MSLHPKFRFPLMSDTESTHESASITPSLPYRQRNFHGPINHQSFTSISTFTSFSSATTNSTRTISQNFNGSSSTLTSVVPTRSTSFANPRSSTSTLDASLTHFTSQAHRVPNILAEDQDANLQVRKVYAYLGQVGVPGDGSSEGLEVERTRDNKSISNQFLNYQNQGRNEEHRTDVFKPEPAALGDADRYGFFSPSKPKALVQLQSAPFFPSTSAFTYSSSPDPMTPTARKDPEVDSKSESRKITKWGAMLEGDVRDGGSNILAFRLSNYWNSHRDKFVKRCYKGIPDRWRRAGWDLLIREFGDKIGWDKEQSADILYERYAEAAMFPSEYDDQIAVDVPRTIDGHIFFRTHHGRSQRDLFQVLHAFSSYCETCGYCREMGPIAATLLTYFDVETAYICMVRLHDWYNFHEIFPVGFPGLSESFYIQERLIEYLLPDVYQTFVQQKITTSSYATKWYLNLFTGTVPFEAQLRLWDVFFLRGMDVLILASVSIIYALRNEIGRCTTRETLQTILSSGFGLEGKSTSLWIRSIRKLAERKDVKKLLKASRLEWNAGTDRKSSKI